MNRAFAHERLRDDLVVYDGRERLISCQPMVDRGGVGEPVLHLPTPHILSLWTLISARATLEAAGFTAWFP